MFKHHRPLSAARLLLVQDTQYNDIAEAGRHNGYEEPKADASPNGKMRPVLKTVLVLAFLSMVIFACALTQHPWRRTGDKANMGSVTMLGSIGPAKLYEKNQKGKGRHIFIGKHDKGICGYEKELEPSGLKKVAMSQPDSGGVRSCGMCIKVWSKDKGPIDAKGEFFFVSHLCQVCKEGDLGLTINETIAKNISVTWQAVPCPLGNNGIEYKLEGSSQYYVKVRPLKARFPVEKIQIQDGGKWVNSTLPAYGYYFELRSENGGFKFPLQVRLTAITGDVLEDTITDLTEKVQLGGGKVQFKDPTFALASPPKQGRGGRRAGYTSTHSLASSSTSSFFLVGIMLVKLFDQW